jgi:hypothetical protein
MLHNPNKPAKKRISKTRYELAPIDIETRSKLDLKKYGAYRYAADASTEVLCAAWALEDGPVQLWIAGQPAPKDLAAHICAGGKVLAHNASFERLIFREILGPQHGRPVPEIEQFRCPFLNADDHRGEALSRARACLGWVQNAKYSSRVDGFRFASEL